MSGTGRVVDVDSGHVPNSDKAARRVMVDRDDGKRLLFYIPKGCDPVVGDVIGWGPHWAEFGGQRVKKLSWEIDPDAPLA